MDFHNSHHQYTLASGHRESLQWYCSARWPPDPATHTIWYSVDGSERSSFSSRSLSQPTVLRGDYKSDAQSLDWQLDCTSRLPLAHISLLFIDSRRAGRRFLGLWRSEIPRFFILFSRVHRIGERVPRETLERKRWRRQANWEASLVRVEFRVPHWWSVCSGYLSLPPCSLAGHQQQTHLVCRPVTANNRTIRIPTHAPGLARRLSWIAPSWCRLVTFLLWPVVGVSAVVA